MRSVVIQYNGQTPALCCNVELRPGQTTNKLILQKSCQAVLSCYQSEVSYCLFMWPVTELFPIIFEQMFKQENFYY
ncbi:hypothetical protein CDAR_522351 [Caerostris darwini]|uniref:Uncharacterized protein n=1 Tax=Caerostris darwini TaxID=1538125 RepID=A0AAV4NRL3_9ARAC|nr:hypothetical protein CDAR_522351 [Caerostris darwini]